MFVHRQRRCMGDSDPGIRPVQRVEVQQFIGDDLLGIFF